MFIDFEETGYNTLCHIETGTGKDRKTMAEQYHLDVLHQGINVWNQWRQEHHSIQPDFSSVDFKVEQLGRVNLAGARLNGADFSGADLRDSLLIRADLSESILSRANLARADLQGANLRAAILSDANLSDAILSNAVLSDADLTGAILTGAEVTGTDFSGVDFRDADLSGIDFSKANTHGARLGKAYFSRRSDTLLDESYQQSLRADTQRQQGKQRAGFDAEDLDERAHEDWANDE